MSTGRNNYSQTLAIHALYMNQVLVSDSWDLMKILKFCGRELESKNRVSLVDFPSDALIVDDI